MKRKASRLWTKEEIKIFRKRFPNMPTKALAEEMNRSIYSIQNAAHKLGLRKSAAFMASPASGRTNGRQGEGFRFPSGHKTWNKGMKGWQPGGRSKVTQFKKGQRPKQTQPVGTVKLDDDGYSLTKISHNRKRRLRWRPTHVLLWEKRRGKIPRGKIVVFKNKNKTDIRIGNLEVISRRENMVRNSMQNFPKPIRRLIQLTGVLRRAINKRRKNENH